MPHGCRHVGVNSPSREKQPPIFEFLSQMTGWISHPHIAGRVEKAQWKAENMLSTGCAKGTPLFLGVSKF